MREFRIEEYSSTDDINVGRRDKVIKFANACQCGYFSLSTGKIDHCPTCKNKIRSEKIGITKDNCIRCISCNHTNVDDGDVCEDCGGDSIEKSEIQKKIEIDYLNLFEHEGEEKSFHEELLQLWYQVGLFLQNNRDEELNKQWLKIYRMILKRDKLVAQGNIRYQVNAIAKRYGVE